MAITVGTLITRVRATLIDPSPGVYWTDAELIEAVNGAISAVVSAKPDANSVTTAVTLAQNTTKQNIPANGFAFLDAINNATSGRAITQVSRNYLDHEDPDWHTTTGTVIKHYTFDERNPNVFYVYPAPSSNSVSINILYSALPARVASTGDTLPLSEIYEDPIYFFTLAEAYAKNTKRGDLNKASSYYSLAYSALGEKTKMQIPYSPRTTEKQ